MARSSDPDQPLGSTMQATSVDDPGRFRKLLAAAVAGLLLLIAAAGLRSYRALDAAHAREAELEARIATSRGEIEELRSSIALLADDPVALDSLAREELWMAGPSEVVIVLPAELEAPTRRRGPALQGPPARTSR